MTEKRFCIVEAEILPEAIKKTIQAKEILARGEAETINQAVEKVGLSRSAFYKYKDGVFPFYEASKEKIITLALLLEHRSGVLSVVLNSVAAAQGNIITINQNIPLQGIANATLSLNTAEMIMSLEEFLEKTRAIPGVKKVELIGQN